MLFRSNLTQPSQRCHLDISQSYLPIKPPTIHHLKNPPISRPRSSSPSPIAVVPLAAFHTPSSPRYPLWASTCTYVASHFTTYKHVTRNASSTTAVLYVMHSTHSRNFFISRHSLRLAGPRKARPFVHRVPGRPPSARQGDAKFFLYAGGGISCPSGPTENPCNKLTKYVAS